MKKEIQVSHQEVEHIPEILDAHTVYVSKEHLTTIHLCMCGCGQETVLSTDEKGWRLSFDGGITFAPSIQNTFACRSHYFIRKGKVVWC